jgi:hypothetical protein
MNPTLLALLLEAEALGFSGAEILHGLSADRSTLQGPNATEVYRALALVSPRLIAYGEPFRLIALLFKVRKGIKL